MIVTVTANPSVDRTIEVDRLSRGQIHRAAGVQVHPGGKGVNVARALVCNGFKSRAVVPVGGADGEQFIALLTDYSIEVSRVPTAGTVRSNISVVEPDATVTKFNEPGAPLTAADTRALTDAVLDGIGDASWVVIAGSLPPRVAPDYYAGLIRELADSGVPVALDTSGPALREAIPAGPSLIKPNHEELEEATGTTLSTMDDVVRAAERLRERGAGAVLVSLGSEGAVLVDGEVHHARSPAVARSAVGAGDALLAGFLAGGAEGISALVTGVAWGAAAASLPGSTMPGPDDLHPELVEVTERLDHDRLARRLSR